ncbi:MAG: thiamine-phosphate pyrophosphorylase [Blastocatellia bacterium]|jgi:thiamine-phosphate pyrophosphorylase|nr:thiamine-phosphate pyrophosphorylase [Blastocatellia bacterium]
MTFDLPQLYAITDMRSSRLSHAAQVGQLAAGGATLIQLREKHLPARNFYEEAEAAITTARTLGVKIIINDRVDIAMALQADGVHLGQSDLAPNEARKLLGPDAIIGLSVHNEAQAHLALTLPVNYLAAGPIFPTGSKSNPDPVLGVEGLSQIRQILGDFPLVAIGGISIMNAAEVFAAGADSVALISGLLSNGDIAATTQAFLRIPPSNRAKTSVQQI